MDELKRSDEENEMKGKIAMAAIIIISLLVASCINYATSDVGIEYIFGQYK